MQINGSWNLRHASSGSQWFYPRTFVVILQLWLLPGGRKTNTMIYSTVLWLIRVARDWLISGGRSANIIIISTRQL